MSKEFTAEIVEKAKAAKTPDELTTIAKENGIELTAGEAKEYYDKLNKSGELADDELDNVSGGGCGDKIVFADESDESFIKAGDENGICPACGKGTVSKTSSNAQYAHTYIYKCSACGKRREALL